MATLAVYWQVRHFDFVNFDDDIYVYDNRHVREGLTSESINWAFSFADKEKTYWHPVAWLSHMLDCHLFGVAPGRHHLSNLIIHIANSMLLFMIFNWMTGELWKSALVAMLFAVHPMNVEAVAWVTERKSVLSTFFWMLTMLAYVYYSKRVSIYRYLLIALTYAIGLMAKPMLVTLPFVLLLLDYWPLGRSKYKQTANKSNKEADEVKAYPYQGYSAFRLVLEKIPLLALSGLSIIISLLSVQDPGKAIQMSTVPLTLRFANAFVSYVKYIGKMIWPQNLAVYYPYPITVPIWQTAGALVILALISVFTLRSAKRTPYFIVGWLWYLGTLFPVIGLVQAGLWPAMADRFSYIPFIGLYVIIAWGISAIAARRKAATRWFAISAIFAIAIMMTITFNQVGYWRNSIALYEHALTVTSHNHIANYNLGTALGKQGRTAEAIDHYLQAIQIWPSFADAHYNLGNAFYRQNRTAEAIDHYLQTLRIRPDFEKAHNNLGSALGRQGRLAEAVHHYSQALRIRPDYEEAHNNLGAVLARQGRTAEAIDHYLQALRIRPDFAEAHFNVGKALDKQGRTQEAIEHFLQALRIKPDYEEVHNNLGIIHAHRGDIEGAIASFRKALEINPDYVPAKNNLRTALEIKNKTQ